MQNVKIQTNKRNKRNISKETNRKIASVVTTVPFLKICAYFSSQPLLFLFAQIALVKCGIRTHPMSLSIIICSFLVCFSVFNSQHLLGWPHLRAEKDTKIVLYERQHNLISIIPAKHLILHKNKKKINVSWVNVKHLLVSDLQFKLHDSTTLCYLPSLVAAQCCYSARISLSRALKLKIVDSRKQSCNAIWLPLTVYEREREEEEEIEVFWRAISMLCFSYLC